VVEQSIEQFRADSSPTKPTVADKTTPNRLILRFLFLTLTAPHTYNLAFCRCGSKVLLGFGKCFPFLFLINDGITPEHGIRAMSYNFHVGDSKSRLFDVPSGSGFSDILHIPAG